MITDMQLLQIKNAVMRVLHVPGNYTGGNLEMAVAVDYSIPLEELREDCARIASALKRQDEIFRNVRLNLIRWVSDECIIKESSSLPALQMGAAFLPESDPVCENKTIDELLSQMKLYYARSKVILLLAGEGYLLRDEEAASKALNPFLKRKLILIQKGECRETERLKELRNIIKI